MDALKEYKISQAKERLKELNKIVTSLDAGNMLDALYAIYNNKLDKEAMIPAIKIYFEKQLEETENQLRAYNSL